MEAITRENRNLHTFADAIVRVVDTLPRSAPVAVLAADMRSEVEARVAQTKEGSAYERVRAVLDNPSLLKPLSNTLPGTYELLRSLVWNGTDDRNQRLAKNATDPVKKVHAARALTKRDKAFCRCCLVCDRHLLDLMTKKEACDMG